MQNEKNTKTATQAAKAEVKETAKAATEAVEAKAKEAASEVQDAAKKKPGRKPGRKPGSAVKKEKAELELKVVIETPNRPDVDIAAVQEKIKAKFVSEGHRAGAIKKFEIYVQPENNKAYYVINDGKFNGDVDLF